MISRTKRENVPYVLESERALSEDQQTTFLLATLPNHLMLTILQLMQQGETRAWVELALTAGLRGWTNFKDPEGRETPFRRELNHSRVVHGIEIKGPVSKDTLEVIPSNLLIELATAIVKANQITGDDAKN